MKSFYSLILGLSLSFFTHHAFAQNVPLAPEKIQEMTQMLKDFKDKEEVKKPIKLIYFHASDRTPIAGYQERITEWFKDYNDFFRKEFKRNGFGEREIPLDYTDNGLIQIYVVKGKKTDEQYGYDFKHGFAIYEEAKEALKGKVDLTKETGLIICALSRTDEGKKSVKLYSPFYGLGLGNQKTGWALVVDQEWLEIKNIPKTQPTIFLEEHQQRPISLGSYATTYIGGALHELGHALGLPHDFETGEEIKNGVPLMGSGNYTYRATRRGEAKDTYLAFCEAVRLVSHPFFSNCRKEENYQPRGNFTKFTAQFNLKTGLQFTGIFNEKLPTYAVVAYCDPEGNDDYNSLAYTQTVAKNGEFSILIPTIPQGKFKVRLVFCSVNGGSSQIAINYEFRNNNLIQE